MTKAFCYLRVSGRGQIDGDGFTRQLDTIKRYAQVHGLRIMKVFREEGVGGATDLEGRPALLEMMEALAADGTKLVLIEKLDRLARDLMVQETTLAICGSGDSTCLASWSQTYSRTTPPVFSCARSLEPSRSMRRP